MADGREGRLWSRPRLSWMDGVKVAFGDRGMPMEPARQCVKDRKEWRALVQMWMIVFNAAIFSWPCVLSDRPPELRQIITCREWDTVT